LLSGNPTVDSFAGPQSAAGVLYAPDPYIAGDLLTSASSLTYSEPVTAVGPSDFVLAAIRHPLPDAMPQAL
jgi:hypothetical protein